MFPSDTLVCSRRGARLSQWVVGDREERNPLIPVLESVIELDGRSERRGNGIHHDYTNFGVKILLLSVDPLLLIVDILLLIVDVLLRITYPLLLIIDPLLQ